MKIKTEFKTRKSAAAYLAERGWVKVGQSLGDWVFKNPGLPQGNDYRIIVQLKTGNWRVQHIDPFVAYTLDGKTQKGHQKS